jgi:hypothetical protein
MHGENPLMDATHIDADVLLAQFNRLLNELVRGTMNRNCFQPWEIEILLDIQGSTARESGRKDLLKRYQKAVQRDFERGARFPMKMSTYLEGLKSKRIAQLELAGEPAPTRPAR